MGALVWETASISKLKASLSHYLCIVRTGEEVLVTDRGKAVAKLVPVSQEDPVWPHHLRELEKAGLIRLGSGEIPASFWSDARSPDPEGRALQALLDERAESR